MRSYTTVKFERVCDPCLRKGRRTSATHRYNGDDCCDYHYQKYTALHVSSSSSAPRVSWEEAALREAALREAARRAVCEEAALRAVLEEAALRAVREEAALRAFFGDLYGYAPTFVVSKPVDASQCIHLDGRGRCRAKALPGEHECADHFNSW